MSLAGFKKKGNKSPHKTLLVKLGLCALLVVLALVVIANMNVYKKKRELGTQIKGLEQKVQDLKEKNSQLKESTARADDQSYIEKVAREELELQQPGEKVISFVSAETQMPKTESNQGFLHSWLSWLGGWLKK